MQSQTISWSGTTGKFTDGANWQGGQVPQSFNSILIGNGGPAQASSSIDVSDVTLGVGASGALEVLPGLTSYFTPHAVYVGRSASGSLSIGSEALLAAAGDLYAGYNPGANGVVNLDGGYLSPFTVYLGYQGNATGSIPCDSHAIDSRSCLAFREGSRRSGGHHCRFLHAGNGAGRFQ